MLEIETLRNGTCVFFHPNIKEKNQTETCVAMNIPTKNIKAKIIETSHIFPVTNSLFYLSLDYRQLEPPKSLNSCTFAV